MWSLHNHTNTAGRPHRTVQTYGRASNTKIWSLKLPDIMPDSINTFRSCFIHPINHVASVFSSEIFLSEIIVFRSLFFCPTRVALGHAIDWQSSVISATLQTRSSGWHIIIFGFQRHDFALCCREKCATHAPGDHRPTPTHHPLDAANERRFFFSNRYSEC